MPLRFRPPQLALSAEVRWMLVRAFGPPGAPFADAVDPAAALAMALIAARHGRERLAGTSRNPP